MASASPVVVLEFNELCPSLLQRFMAERRLPGFSRLYGQSQIYTTVAAERGPHLDPWIQWITVHAGVNHDRHGIEHLGDGHKFDRPRVWDLLSDAGLKVWVCGSMNASYRAPINGHVVPDPWTVTPSPFPAGEFEPYCSFIRSNVLEHSNGRVPLSTADQARFVRFMVSHGLSLATATSICKQLVTERVRGDHWKRAVLLDQLQCDLFCHVHRRERPDFSTLFLNSTAHLQHAYWRNMEPELFKVKPDAAEQRRLGSAVRYGYEQMDRVVTRLMRFLGPDCTIVLCTALSQQPCLIYEDAGGKTAYRPHDFSEFLSFAGIADRFRVDPVMAHQFHVQFDSDEHAERAVQRLDLLRLEDGSKLMRADRRGSGVFCGCQIYHAIPADARVEGGGSGGAPSGSFFDLFYQCVGLKSGMHHPDGVLWIRTPDMSHAVHDRRDPLDSVAPTLLALSGQATPAYMSGRAVHLDRRDEPLAQSGRIRARDIEPTETRAAREASRADHPQHV
jgi:hypothetical protein